MKTKYLLVFATLFIFTSCGETPSTSQVSTTTATPTTVEPTTATPTTATPPIVAPTTQTPTTQTPTTIVKNNFTNISFESKTVYYDGNTHFVEVTGAPSFANISYKSDVVGVTNYASKVGVYHITATITADNYNDLVLTATLTITEETNDMKYDRFTSAFNSSQPTIINSRIYYYRPDLDITLTFTSTLKIEYDFIIKAEYTYSYQKLNSLSLDGNSEMISTHSGTVYGYNKNFGQYENGEINWYTNINSSLDVLTLDLSKSNFESMSFQGNSMHTTIKNDKIDEFLTSSTPVDAKDMTFAFAINEDQISSANISYIDKYNAQVDIITTYTYEDIIINIPGV